MAVARKRWHRNKRQCRRWRKQRGGAKSGARYQLDALAWRIIIIMAAYMA